LSDDLSVVLLFLALVAAAGLLAILRAGRKAKARERTRSQKLTESEESLMFRIAPLCKRIPPALRGHWEGKVRLFLAEKTFVGCQGLEVTDELRLALRPCPALDEPSGLSWPALLAGLVLATLAALTKPYFALGWGIVVSHLFLFGPPRRAFAYLGLSAALAAIVAAVLHAVAPYYYLSTVVFHRAVAGRHHRGEINDLILPALQIGSRPANVQVRQVRKRQRRTAEEDARAAGGPPSRVWRTP